MNNDTRKPTLSELVAANERAKAQRLRDSLQRATAKVNADYSEKRKQWLAFWCFPIDGSNDAATPSPDMPADYNDGSEADHE